ncbi:hypothetical protein [Streptomyces clavuligerus]|uniref:Uncharacterized protein n=1 Tax=Streptomyces clavuligerus TaxID=1901 RepID=B5GPI7_STRCL|nr:hypothetical protein [Streptomyces clavuligerus]ANW19624.1 hypothetical protein BB341_16050 [Streptomyces clavuligerus]AXU14231.1 hypothetical protein D1794_16740 [Streptomyces clavuligerus]EDY48233.1 hypothetical protein SSCG_01514 [Streptomyces clavuligerus]EFG07555.1 Hypothetical protein SCLAV_2482 [Streptomyces clavuligerus]MBY6304232.1 hypothetical protein [Streptomyces clavuligerus]
MSHKVTVTSYHPDGTVCPPDHKYTTSNRPLAEGCTGRGRFIATCTCGTWTEPSATKGYAADMGRRHRITASRNPN